ARFQKHAVPEDLPEVVVAADADGMGVAHVLKAAGLVSSTSEAFRMIGQGAVRVDGERVEDRATMFEPGVDLVMQVGRRRFARVSITLRTEGTGT
ncbi:MAG: S4 domain-containing protein, partial [Pseudomonadota bacterium]